MIYNKTCLICAKAFTTLAHQRKYCCVECRRIASNRNSRLWQRLNGKEYKKSITKSALLDFFRYKEVYL